MDEIEKLTPDIQFLIKVSARPHTLAEAVLSELSAHHETQPT